MKESLPSRIAARMSILHPTTVLSLFHDVI